MMTYIVLLLIGVVSCKKYVETEDIPIESFDHSDFRENEMDLELLQTKNIHFSPDSVDPKAHFFRSSTQYDEESLNLPKPGGLKNADFTNYKVRNKRNADDVPIFVHNVKQVKTESPKNERLAQSLGKPLELSLLESDSITTEKDPAILKQIESPRSKKELEINDFIRFRRSAQQTQKKSNSNSDQDNIASGQSEKLVMEPPHIESTREPRGTSTSRINHWSKQQHPVRRNDEFSFDNAPASSENVKAPRVHFVTQRLSENSAASSEYKPYAREARARDFNTDLSKDLSREIDHYQHQPRYSRHYSSLERPYYRDDYYSRNGPRDYHDTYSHRYEADRDTPYPSSSNYQRQKRIIYYATLPDISRTPPNVDLRDRYNYNRDRYDEPYVREPYHFRKVYPTSRYEQEYEHNRARIPYPLKVSTDVNVSEVKKNPERRIYSDVDLNRYGYNSPYQTKRN